MCNTSWYVFCHTGISYHGPTAAAAATAVVVEAVHANNAVLRSCFQEMKEQKEELLSKVQALKTDLQDWRSKLEAQVKNYKSVREQQQLLPQGRDA